MRDFVLTSESVTRGHPDKLCDQISDAVVDAFLAADGRRAVTAECAVASGIVFLATRCAGTPQTDLAALARRVIAECGYRAGPFSAESCSVLSSVSSIEAGAEGDRLARQGVTSFGYACRHTASLMPFSIAAAHALARGLDQARESGALPWLAADAQSQVAVVYRDRRPAAVHSLVLTTGLSAELPEELRRDDAALLEALTAAVIEPAFEALPVRPDRRTRILVNRAGPGMAGGPTEHAGLTGRKTACDGYGGFARQGTSALSGKDPGRIDRISGYAARHAAKCVVAAGLAEECEVQLSYAVGEAQPIGLEVDCFGSARLPEAEIDRRLGAHFDFTVAGIARRFRLWDLPAERGGRFYRDLAAYGQVGRDDLSVPWEDTGEAAALAD